MSDHNQEEDHSGPIKTPKQLLIASFLAFVVPVFIIIGLVFYVTSGSTPPAGVVNPEKAVSERIQKVGSVEIRDANRPARAGEEVYKAQCSVCHATGALGSPKFADAVAWGPRIRTGLDALVNSSLKGKNSMPAQGGGDFSSFEIARGVAYMANAAGAKFAEPKQAAAVAAK
jgi:cytochrome c5